MSTRQKWILGLLLTAFLFANPLTRKLVLWILPLGRGVDDLIVWLALTIAAIIYLVTQWEKIDIKQKIKDLQKAENRKSLQITLTVIAGLIALAIPAIRNELWDWFFFGDPIDKPADFYIVLGLISAFIVLVWAFLDKVIKIKEKDE